MVDTAIIAGSDEMALGAKESLPQHGRVVPCDVSLIGFQYRSGSFYCESTDVRLCRWKGGGPPASQGRYQAK